MSDPFNRAMLFAFGLTAFCLWILIAFKFLVAVWREGNEVIQE